MCRTEPDPIERHEKKKIINMFGRPDDGARNLETICFVSYSICCIGRHDLSQTGIYAEWFLLLRRHHGIQCFGLFCRKNQCSHLDSEFYSSIFIATCLSHTLIWQTCRLRKIGVCFLLWFSVMSLFWSSRRTPFKCCRLHNDLKPFRFVSVCVTKSWRYCIHLQ